MKKALQGITVLDFSQLLAGPFATMMLADMGAEVIKVERLKTGDGMRNITFFNSYFEGGDSPCFMAWNRNKKSISIDIKNQEARDILYKMVKTADVVVENFRPGVMERLGYGYEKLKEINPKIIYASNYGFGSSGPYVNRPGQDMLIQGLVGLTTLTGQNDNPPTPLGTGLPDMLSSFHLVYAILSAIIYRQNTGEGQRVEVDLMRSTMALESQEFMTLLNMPVNYERPNSGIGHPFQQAPFGIYACSDGHIAIAMSPFTTLVEVLGDNELLKYNDNKILFENRDEVFYAVSEITKTNTVNYWLEKMLEKDIWVAEIKDITEAEFDPQVKHMKAITSFEHKKAGTLRCVSPAVTMSKTQPTIESAPPIIGEHTKEILISYGIDQETINKMIDDNIITVNK